MENHAMEYQGEHICIMATTFVFMNTDDAAVPGPH